MKKGPGQNEIRKVEHTLSRYHMLEPGDRVIVAVSGGADSVCLLHILFRLKDVFRLDLVVAHLDHGLRPDVDEEETLFVAALAESLSLPFVTRKAENRIEAGGGSLEEKARKLRYDFLQTVKTERTAQKIAMGHTLNDQAETVLMRLMRGSGSSGLAGIPPMRDEKIIRPLIELTREEVQHYLNARALTFLTDASNEDTTYLRNHIRLNLIPQLKAIQPKIVEHLGRTADLMRAEKAYLEQEAAKWLINHEEIERNGDIQIPLAGFRALPKALRRHVVRQALSKAGGTLRRVSRKHIGAIGGMADSVKPQASISLPKGVWARRCYGTMRFTTEKTEGKMDFSRRLDGPGQWAVDTLTCMICLEEVERVSLSEITHSPWIVYLDGSCIRYPLVLRNVRPGDRFIPLGMTGRRKVKDFFIDLKVPCERRKQIPILAQGDKIIWICGLRIDERFKVTPRTETVLKVFFQPPEPVDLFTERQ